MMKRIKVAVVLMLILTVFMGTLINVDAEINDSDEDVKILVEDFSTSEVPASFSDSSSNGRSTFFKDGVVTAVKERKNVYTLYYYDKEGKLLKKAELPNSFLVEYIEAHDDFLYIIANEKDADYSLYKLDENLDVVGNVYFFVDCTRCDAFGDPFLFDSSLGMDFLEFTDENIIMYTCSALYRIDYNLKRIEQVEYPDSSEYIEKYFPSMKLGLVVDDDVLFVSNNFSAETKKGKFNFYSFSKSSVGTIFADRYVNNQLIRKEIKNEDYKIFSRTKIIDDYIVTVGGKQKEEIVNVTDTEFDEDYDSNLDEDSDEYYEGDPETYSLDSSYISDIVLYNLDGELVQTVPVDKVVNYLNVSDGKITFSTQVYDGVCTYDKYENDDIGCDILTDISTYSLVEKRYADNAGNKNNSVITIKNPQTASTIVFVASIICFVACCVGALIASIKKQKMIKG